MNETESDPAQNIDVSKELAKDDDTLDVNEDDYRPDPDAQEDDRAAGDHDS